MKYAAIIAMLLAAPERMYGNRQQTMCGRQEDEA